MGMERSLKGASPLASLYSWGLQEVSLFTFGERKGRGAERGAVSECSERETGRVMR